ncbi:hypothetical protein WSM22_13030 [Cytophagales bacterium WSM2-2]|nr:hypothetical protein WSM22_13030 [Cytophagales bacterium WSM2-2]
MRKKCIVLVLVVSFFSSYSQNSPLTVNNTSGQAVLSLTSGVGYGSMLALQRFNNTSNYYTFEAGAGSNDDLRLTVNGNWPVPVLSFKTDGKIGAGTASPRSVFEIAGSQAIDWQETASKGSGLLTVGSIGTGGSLFINTPTHDSYYSSGLGIDGSYDATNRVSQVNIKSFGVKYLSWSSTLAFHVSNGTSLNEAMRINNAGNVGIGTTDPKSFKLAVNGKIWGTEVQVALTNPGPDYVFEKDYHLLSLDEVHSYIEKNKHLPEVPSAKEMEVNGVNVGDMNMLLLKKVEELTLYMIELKKENAQMKEENERQNKLINDLIKK